MRQPKFLIALMLGWLATVAGAAEVGDLHEGRAVVADQSDAARAAALKPAFEYMLVKLTGRGDSAASPAGAALAARAGEFVLSQAYAGGGAAPLELVVGFDPARVDAALDEAGLRRWGSRRPATLVWLVVERPEGAVMLGSDDHGAGAGELAAIASRARARGLPLMFPLLDLEEQALVGPANVVGRDAAALSAAAQRYAPDAVVGAHARPEGEGWRVDWTLYQGDVVRPWQNLASGLDEALVQGVDALADTLAAATVLFAGQAEGRLPLHVLGVTSFDAFARVDAHLRGLEGLREVALRRAAPGELVYEVLVAGGPAGLAFALQSGGMLRPALDGTPDRYELLPGYSPVGVSATPETPGMPGMSETPAMSEAPELPGMPGIPEAPGAPETPGMPEAPRMPELPEAVGVPGVPEPPATPGPP